MPRLTLGEIQRLHKQHTRLEKQYDELLKKIEYLESVRTKKSDAVTIYDLTQQIGAEESELAGVEAKLRDIEQTLESIKRPSPSDLLREDLCTLNHDKQINSFEAAIGKSWVLAFLVYGKREYGHSWLLYRFEKKLLAHQGKPCQTERLRFDLSSQFSERSIDALWRKLGVRVGINIPPFAQHFDKDAIVVRVREWLKTKNVELIFYNLHDMNSEDMEELIQGFWHPLIEQIRNLPGQSSSNYLLMFLIDERGCVHKWNFHCVDSIGENWKAGDPIKLAELTEFTDDAIADWIVKEGKKWPNLLEKDRPRLQEIMTYSNNGVPRGVLEYICYLCGCRWDEEEGWVVYDQFA